MKDDFEGGHRPGGFDGPDLLRAVRERPLASLGVVLGAGVLLGLLTGGKKEPELRTRTPERSGGDPELWEKRARRLLRLAREQREELERLRAIRWGGEGDELEDIDDDEYDDDEEPGGGAALGGLAELVKDGLQRLIRNARASG
jgi:hypothetical protein